jgi:thiamine biosynthesis protein ThiS
MRVTINGKQRELAPASTVAALIEELGLSGPYALVERNGVALERSRFGETALAEGDVLIVARPVAGG